MNDDQITALAREYAEEISPVNQLNDYPEAKMIADMMRNALSEVIDDKIKDFEGFVRFLLCRYVLVERSKFEELEIARRAKEHGAVWLNRWEAERLFPEIAKEVES